MTQTREYQAFMKSQAWQMKRNQVLRRDGYRCQDCGSSRHLEVDHLRYPPPGASEEDFARQLLYDLETVCHACHVKRTYERGQHQVSYATPSYIWVIIWGLAIIAGLLLIYLVDK